MSSSARTSIGTIWRVLRTVLVACLTLATVAVMAGWVLGLSRNSWTLNSGGLSPGLRESGNGTWRVLATLYGGWLCVGYKGHTTPQWPENWACGGPSAVRFDGRTPCRSCDWQWKSGWPMPLPGRLLLRFRTEDEVADWVICRDLGASTEIFDVQNNAQCSPARAESDVWATPGRIQKHIVFYAAIPFWALMLITGAIPVLSIVRCAVHNCRRRTTGPKDCPHCGYDLTGNESGICPECGSPVEREKVGQATFR